MTPARELFARHSIRCTRQRLAVFEALRHSQTHPTAEALFTLVKSSVGRLSLATVYNTLDVLCDAGLCRRLPTTHSCCRYDADTTEHPHLRFRDTGEILDVPPDLTARLTQRLPRGVLAEIEQRMGVRIAGINMQLLVQRDEPAA